MKNLFNELDDFEELDSSSETDLNNLKCKITNYSSHKLCELIVCYRYLGFAKEIAIASMEELAKRRINGDQFDFESEIEKSLKDLPVLDFKIPDLRTILNQVTGKK